jgi:hypothetical protein
MFRALFAHHQEALHIQQLVYFVRIISAGCDLIRTIYRVIRKFFQEFRALRYSSRDCHVEGEHVNRGRDTPQVSVLPYRCSICPFCCVCLGCCASEFGSSGGTYELPYIQMVVYTVPPDEQNSAGNM